MRIHLEIFGRRASLAVHEYDVNTCQLIYFHCGRGRSNKPFNLISLESAGSDGGIQLRIVRDGKTRGWRLRGPVEHLEDNCARLS